MRNLFIAADVSSVFSGSKGNVTSTTVDVDNDVVFAVSESMDVDGIMVDFQIWRTDEKSPSTLVTEVSSPSSGEDRSQAVCLRYLPEIASLCLVTASGDIVIGQTLDDVCTLEVVGSVEGGIKCADWSPDHDILILVTGEYNLLQMSRDFDVISEAPLRRSDFGEDQAVNVGWGSKQTQFHGSLGKTAAVASPEQAAIAARGGSSPDDDGFPRISWRGDGAFFVVSSRDRHDQPPPNPDPYTHLRRVLRVYDRTGALQSTSEPTPGLEQALAWKPSGGLIASAQRFGFHGGGQGIKGRHDIVFYERNGLRHGEFTLREDYRENADAVRRWGYRIRELSWNSDSTVLAAWVERDDGDYVQLWTTGNYHWYLKQELAVAGKAAQGSSRFTSLSWHPEDPSRLVLTDPTEARFVRLMWDTSASVAPSPNDHATVAVVDGSSLLMTPFRLQNVPPPMSSYKIPQPHKHLPPPTHLSLSPNSDVLAAVFPHGSVQVWALRTKAVVTKGDVAAPVLVWSGEVLPLLNARQVLVLSNPQVDGKWDIYTLGTSGNDNEVIVVTHLEEGKVQKTEVIGLPEVGKGRMFALGVHRIGWEKSDGTLYEIDQSTKSAVVRTSLPEYCPYLQSFGTDNVLGLSPSGKLYVSGLSGSTAATLSTNCTSFSVGSGFAIFTTATHYAKFAPLDQVGALTTDGAQELPEWEQRRVERGSRIVTVIPSAMSLVLQMPRGNLETVNPRSLVLSVVRKDIDDGNYRKAFLGCRKHRIDLNVLVDHNPQAFMANLASFVSQIEEVDYINIFLSGIGQSNQPPERIAEICDALRVELEKKDYKKYINAIMTAHVVKTPPDVEAALCLLPRLRETDPDIVEDAVKYIMFLVDADKLFDTALGMYDFSLVLMVAQHHPKKDPREYLPFLRELRDLGDKFGQGYQRFKIDDHLKRHTKALAGLHDTGSSKFEEALAYIEKHQLYQEALRLWAADHSGLGTILNLYGDYFYDRREFRQAAIVFQRANKPRKAMLSYEKAFLWQELFALAVSEGLSFDELCEMGRRIGEELASRKRFSEAGRILLDYAKNIDEAVTAYGQGGEFAEAERICAMESRMDLIQTALYPTSFEVRDQIGEDIEEMAEQLKKQTERLRELREKKAQDPDAFYNPDRDPSNLQNVDVMTDAGSVAAFSTFTRYTAAPSTASKKSRATSKSRRKQARNRGKKGTVEEEEYILLSIAKIPTRLEAIQARASKVLPFLLKYSDEHREQGKDLQQEIFDLDKMIRKTVEEAWKENDEDEEALERTSRPPQTYLPRKPDLPSVPTTSLWEVKLLS